MTLPGPAFALDFLLIKLIMDKHPVFYRLSFWAEKNRGYMKSYPLSIVFLCILFVFGVLTAAFGSDCIVDPQVEQSCRTCHADVAEFIDATPHRILVTEEGKRVKNSPCGCTNCHRFYAGHPEELKNVENPARLSADKNYRLCSQCHLNPHIQEYAEFNVHLRNNISCSKCHSAHDPKAEHLLAAPSDEVCLSCHKNLRVQFLEVSHHPVLEKVMGCIDCHRVLRDFEGMFMEGNPNRRCYGCHAEFSPPFGFEHEAAVYYSIQEGSCGSCHLPHGSSNQKLLREPGNNLCLQCHFVPGHKNPHPGIVPTEDYTKHNCIECHADIHGSYQSKYFLDFQALDFECVSCHRR
jgi:DmsE family decaheme c-type cytochrome